MIKGSKILLLSAVCLSLCSCSTGPVGRTLDCVDLWRFNNCIVFPKNKVTKKRGGVSYRGGKRVYPQSYSASEYKKPSKVWKSH